MPRTRSQSASLRNDEVDPPPPPPPSRKNKKQVNSDSDQVKSKQLERTPVVRLNRIALPTPKEIPEELPSSSRSIPKNQRPIRKSVTQVHYQNPLLPPANLFPMPTDQFTQQVHKLKTLRTSVLQIISTIMNQVQKEEDNLVPCYESIEKLYEYVNEVMNGHDDSGDLCSKYRQVCVSVLWYFGPPVWKLVTPNRSNNNEFAERVSALMDYCFLRLGWQPNVQERRGGRRRSEWVMGDFKQPDVVPACFHVVKQFVKTNNESNTQIRLNQLRVLLLLATTAKNSPNKVLLDHIYHHAFHSLQIRMKDKSNQCRALALQILSTLIDVEGADESVLKQLKFFTRYDPCIEVRRLGTIALGRSERIRIRFFFDQAFDRSATVRAEAFKAMALLKKTEGEGEDQLMRDMDTLQPEKLCKVIIWGMMFSDAKCSMILKDELLPRWLQLSCKNSLIKFLSHLDAYQNMNAVIKILDVMLTTEEQFRFVESLDFSFITELKQQILSKQYEALTIESMVAWLGLCKASVKIESIVPKVVPNGEEMLMLIQSLHECAYLENEKSQLDGRTEDISPIICSVIALEICKFVGWEEGGRRSLKKILQHMLLDPVMDERVLIIQAMNKLHQFVDRQEFEDIMMNVFEEVFDARNERNNRSSFVIQRNGNSTRGGNESLPQVEINRGQDHENTVPEGEQEQQHQAKEPVRLTPYQLTKLREKLCDLAIHRFTLQRRKDTLIQEKRFIDAIPLNNEIMKIQAEESELNQELKLQEELANKPITVLQQPTPSPVPGPSARASIAALAGGMEPVDVPMEDEEEPDEHLPNRSGVINSIEAGLGKGLLMINTYLDLCPGLHPFFRNFYENYAPSFLGQEHEITIRISVVQFLVRVALNDKRELKKLVNMLLLMLFGECETELKNAAFKGIVDLIICYEYSDFVMTEQEKDDPTFASLNREYSLTLQKLVDPNLTYEQATSDHIATMFLEALSKHFPPTQGELTGQELSLTLTTKHQGLLKLLIRGRLRDPSQVSKVLSLWVNHDYAGTPVLKDLDHVLKLYDTFDWWGNSHMDLSLDGEEDQDKEFGLERLRVLGSAIAEGCVTMCQEGKGDHEEVVKFVSYMIGFLDHRDQALMRSISITMLSPVAANPTRSYNTTLVRAASKIPLRTPKSAATIVQQIDSIFKSMRDHPVTASVQSLRKELMLFLGKLKKVHGEDVVVIQGHGEGARTRIVGKDFLWGDEEWEARESGDEAEDNRDEEERDPEEPIFSDSD